MPGVAGSRLHPHPGTAPGPSAPRCGSLAQMLVQGGRTLAGALGGPPKHVPRICRRKACWPRPWPRAPSHQALRATNKLHTGRGLGCAWCGAFAWGVCPCTNAWLLGACVLGQCPPSQSRAAGRLCTWLVPPMPMPVCWAPTWVCTCTPACRVPTRLQACGPACPYTCMPACLHTYMPACLHACMPACLHAYGLVGLHACAPTCLGACRLVCLHAYTLVCLCARVPTCPHAYMPACLHARMPTCPWALVLPPCRAGLPHPNQAHPAWGR